MSCAGPIRRRCVVPQLALVGLMSALGCVEDPVVALVPVGGCGLDQAFSSLRVRVLGDRPASAGAQIELGPGESGSLAELPADAAGVGVEGMFGTTVTAVGRSWGADVSLAAGRVPGVEREADALAVYFAAPDTACAVGEGTALPASLGPAAAGSLGDALVLGEGWVHIDLLGDQSQAIQAIEGHPERIGASAHALGSRRFAVLGGAPVTGGAAYASVVIVDAGSRGGASVSDPLPLTLEGQPWARSGHATARSPADGRVLVAGGCTQTASGGACALGAAVAEVAWLDLASLEEDRTHALEGAGSLEVARAGAVASVSVDGAAYVAGGRGADGIGLGSVERLRPGEGAPSGTWSVVHTLAELEVVGLTVLTGELIILADAAGGLHWWSPAGSGVLDPSLRAPELGALPPAVVVAGLQRPLTTLPGERVLVDGWLFAPGSAAVDPSVERRAFESPGRAGAAPVVLADGTVLLAGGWREDGSAAEPGLLRVRPLLDGPDEWVPDLGGPQGDAFVSNRPGSATVVVGGLRLDGGDAGAGESVDALPRLRAHVRGFRSRSARLELRVAVDEGEQAGDSRAWLVLEQGSAAALGFGFGVGSGNEGLLVRRRGADGSELELECAGTGAGSLADPDRSWILELFLSEGAAGGGGQRVTLRADDGGGADTAELVADCTLDEPWPGTGGLALGFGLSGPGSARFFGLRLARI